MFLQSASAYFYTVIKYFVQIEQFGITFRDPTTAFTNVLMFLAGMWCVRRIAAVHSTHAAAKDWKMFFLLGAIASSIGIIVHGFSYYTPTPVHFWIWIVMGWTQMAGVAFAQIATIRTYSPENLVAAKRTAIIQFVLFASWMVYIRKFAAVNLDVAFGLLPIMFHNFYSYRNKKAASSLLGVGIIAAVAPALVVTFKLMPSPWFNYNDIAHLLLMICTVIMGIGVERNLKGSGKVVG